MQQALAPPELSRVQRFDSVAAEKVEWTPEGYLIDTPIVTSVGIFEYRKPDGGIRRELRLPEHVFAEESLATYEGKPIIITHSAGRVSKDNVDQEIVGTILSPGYRDGDDVRAKIIIHDIDEVKKSGLRELSLGYDLVLDETPGEWEGQHYDAIQTEIDINHLALVREARAGEQARLNMDGDTEIQTEPETTQIMKGERDMSAKKQNGTAMGGEELKKTIVAYQSRRQRRLDEGDPDNPHNSPTPPATPLADEENTTTPEEKVQFIKDRRDRRDQGGDPNDPEAALGVIAQQDEDIGSLLEIIEALQAKSDFDSTAEPVAATDEDEPSEPGSGDGGVTLTIQTDSVDKLVKQQVKDRMNLLRIGDRLNLDGLEEMDTLDMKKAIIKKVNPGMRLDGKSRSYINAAFDVAVEQMNAAKDTDYQRRQMLGRSDGTDHMVTGQTAADRARERMIEKQLNGGTE